MQRRGVKGQDKWDLEKRGNSIYLTHKIVTGINEIREAFPIQVSSFFAANQ